MSSVLEVSNVPSSNNEQKVVQIIFSFFSMSNFLVGARFHVLILILGLKKGCPKRKKIMFEDSRNRVIFDGNGCFNLPKSKK